MSLFFFNDSFYSLRKVHSCSQKYISPSNISPHLFCSPCRRFNSSAVYPKAAAVASTELSWICSKKQTVHRDFCVNVVCVCVSWRLGSPLSNTAGLTNTKNNLLVGDFCMKIRKTWAPKCFVHLCKVTLHHIYGVCECFVFLFSKKRHNGILFFLKQWWVKVQFMQENPWHETCSQFITQNFTFC